VPSVAAVFNLQNEIVHPDGSIGARVNVAGVSTRLDDQVTPTTQVNNFNQLMAQKVNAIIVFPIAHPRLLHQAAPR